MTDLEQAATDNPVTLGNGGFTLLEVMVAMLLLAVIMTTSVTMLFLNIRGWEGLTEHSDATLQEHLIENRLASLIHHIMPLVWRDQGQRLLALDGDARQLHFLSKAPRRHSAGGLFEYLLVAESSPDQGSSLVLYYAPMDPKATQLNLPAEGQRRVLVSGLLDAQFSYFGNKQLRVQGAWHASWEPGSVRYPDLIRLSLNYPGEKAGNQESYFRIQQNHPVTVQVK